MHGEKCIRFFEKLESIAVSAGAETTKKQTVMAAVFCLCISFSEQGGKINDNHCIGSSNRCYCNCKQLLLIEKLRKQPARDNLCGLFCFSAEYKRLLRDLPSRQQEQLTNIPIIFIIISEILQIINQQLHFRPVYGAALPYSRSKNERKKL